MRKMQYNAAAADLRTWNTKYVQAAYLSSAAAFPNHSNSILNTSTNSLSKTVFMYTVYKYWISCILPQNSV